MLLEEKCILSRSNSSKEDNAKKIAHQKHKKLRLLNKAKHSQAKKTIQPMSKLKDSVRAKMYPEVENSINFFIKILARILNNDWEKKDKILVFFISIDKDKDISDHGLNSLHILITLFHKTN